MRSQKKRTIANILLCLLLAYLAYYIIGNANDFRSLLEVSFPFLLLVAAGHLLSIFLNSLFLKFVIEPFDKKINYRQSFAVSLVSTVGNYFLPAGTGVGVRAVYLKKKHNLSYTDFMSTTSGNYIIVFMISSLVGLVSLLQLKSHAPTGQFVPLFGMLSAIFLSMLWLAIFGFPQWLIVRLSNIKGMSRYLGILSNVLKGWNTISDNRLLLIKLTILTILQLLVGAFVVYISVAALGFEIGMWSLLLYTALTSLSLLLNVTPGSIGIRESLFILLGSTLGLSTAQILSISIVEKGVLFFVLLISWALIHFGFIETSVVEPEND